METFQADFKTLFAKAGYSDKAIEELLKNSRNMEDQRKYENEETL